MKLTLKSKLQETRDVFTLVFTSDTPVSWRAGQSIKLELPVHTFDFEERRFTISSAPHEHDIAITTKVTPGLFKRSLLKLQQGDVVTAAAISGDFVWQTSNVPHLFIAGGIGITPFYAMLKERRHLGLSLSAQLLYANSTHDAPFLQKLRSWQHKCSEFMLQYVTRRITSEDIKPEKNSIVYISGPPPMVVKLQHKLLVQGVSLDRIKTDQFIGYKNI